jgi:spore maturation protein CgeB
VKPSHYRILCIGETWLGSDARASFAALRRLGHAIQVLDESKYVTNGSQTPFGKGLRRMFRLALVNQLKRDVVRSLTEFEPHCLFVFKGNWVHPDILAECRARNVVAVNYYPDVSFLSHGPYIPRSLPLYDHIFNTKTHGVTDMKAQLPAREVSFLEPGYDPELHRPVELTADEWRVYGCDVAFIGTWSPKKEGLLAALCHELPEINLKVWGCQWEKNSSANLKGSIMGDEATGEAYTRAIRGASICLGLLSEAGRGSSSGDLITARTFQIPACGTFMLHERNVEVLRYFAEDREAAFFGTPEELAEKVGHYLSHTDDRERTAAAGRQRSLRDGYMIDERMKVIERWLNARLKGSKRSSTDSPLVNHAQDARATRRI